MRIGTDVRFPTGVGSSARISREKRTFSDRGRAAPDAKRHVPAGAPIVTFATIEEIDEVAVAGTVPDKQVRPFTDRGVPLTVVPTSE